MQALLVIDVQNGMFADPAYPPHEGEEMVARIAKLIRAARETGTPVIFIQHDGGEGDPLDANGPGFPIRPELAPLPGEPVVVKRFCSAFQETELARLLAAKNIDEVTICGMQTEYCVDSSARAAFERGLKITLVSDAHTTVDGTIPAAAIIRHHNTTLRNGGFVTLRAAGDVTFGPS